MKYIDELLEKIKDEIEGAEEYAEQYIIHKANNNMTRSAQFREMALQEINHATILRDFSIQDVDAMKKVFTLSEEDKEHWEKCLKKFNEKIAVLRHMVT